MRKLTFAGKWKGIAGPCCDNKTSAKSFILLIMLIGSKISPFCT
ncbi:hypothetical protein [Dyadobacter sp. LHD-138]|nr:hypothetical protein [Dyadobacter sp. LHD-138]MDQ6477926.1 hypothetical protein [Dyadobacter sp. LHD-138]